MTSHKTGTREEWLAARLDLLEAEKALTRRASGYNTRIIEKFRASAGCVGGAVRGLLPARR